jgi:hypothetical protein
MPRSIQWDLWWSKWHWDRFFSELFSFPLSISFHRGLHISESSKKLINSFSFHPHPGMYKRPVKAAIVQWDVSLTPMIRIQNVGGIWWARDSVWLTDSVWSLF